MAVTVSLPKQSLDQCADSRQRPELGRTSLYHRPGLECFDQFTALHLVQSGRPATAPVFECTGAFGLQLQPPFAHRFGTHADSPSDFRLVHALLQQTSSL